jgi:hypothetical protein
MLDFYEKLQEARDAMLDTSNMTAEEVATSGIYKDIDEWINNLSDSYDAVTE